MLQAYRKFVLNNADLVSNIENTLRTLSYVIPGPQLVLSCALMVSRPLQ